MDAIRARKLELKITELDTRIAMLEAGEEELLTTINELNFRVLFAMQHFQFVRQVATGIMDANEQIVTKPEKVTLFDIYLGKRDAFIAEILDKERAADAAAQQENADGQSVAGSPDVTSGSSAPPAANDSRPASNDGQGDNAGHVLAGKFPVH